MIEVLPLKRRLTVYLHTRRIAKQFEKKKALFQRNLFHPSLHTEILEPRHSCIYSFRITLKYRAIFIYRGRASIEIIDINDHYQ